MCVLIPAVVLSALFGLSVTLTLPELLIHGRTFWAWCAFDVFGIFGPCVPLGLFSHVNFTAIRLYALNSSVVFLKAGILRS
jgi:hypothetical protein